MKLETHRDIEKAYRKAQRDRSDEERRVMEKYNEEVFRPTIGALQKRCSELGHVKGYFHDNGLGWHWWYCSYCQSRIDITDRDGNVSQE